MLIGFGTKMGLAPLHAWKPDTYGEAPSLVSGLMAGALTSCAFLGLARVLAVCVAAGPGVAAFARPPLIAFGMLSLAVAAAFMIGQSDVKRMLAYSSVEHMGLLALALGLGGIGTYGAVLHVLNNGLAKALLFLAVGNVALEMGTSEASRIRGLLRRVPASGALLVVGLFAVTGSPPFGMFVSEFTIISAAIREHHMWLAVALVVLLAIIFVAIGAMILEVVYAPAPIVEPPAAPSARGRDRGWLVAAPAMLAVLVLALGLWIPRPLADALSAAATVLGGRAP
jgi:hydrogenase-4 component F